MTRDEIRLVVFVLLAIALGSVVKWWRERGPQQSAAVHLEEKKAGWADPPYVFKSKAVMEKIAQDTGKLEAKSQSETSSMPSHSP
jgi:hypothetical protein